MATITVVADSLVRLEGFIAGVAWTNDSAIGVRSIEPDHLTAVLDDRDADGDRVWRLGPHGLAADTD